MPQRQLDIATSRVFTLQNVLLAIPGLEMKRVYTWRRRRLIELPGRSYMFTGTEVVKLAVMYELTEQGVGASAAASFADLVAGRAQYLTRDPNAPELTEDEIDAYVIHLKRAPDGSWWVLPATAKPGFCLTLRPDRLAWEVIDRLVTQPDQLGSFYGLTEG